LGRRTAQQAVDDDPPGESESRTPRRAARCRCAAAPRRPDDARS
jgi:hypothetical protein